MTKRRLFLSLAAIAIVLSASIPALAQCRASDPTGQYHGSATSAQAGTLEVSLNLLCTDAHYAGTLDTPVGKYTVTGGSFDRGHLQLQLVQGGVPAVTVDATLTGEHIDGTFTSGDDKGPVSLQRTGDAVLPPPTSASASLNPQQWREDLAYLTKELPKRHPGALAHTSKDKFEADSAALESNIAHLNADELYIGFDHLANLIGDGHTYIDFPEDRANLPLDIIRFGDESRVVAVGSGYEQALGAQVTAIQDTPIARARELAAVITPVAETDALRQARIEGFLTTGMALHGLGITPARNSASYTLTSDYGRQFTMNFTALDPGQNPKWVNVFTAAPLYAQPIHESMACTWLKEARALYCNVHEITDLEAPALAMLKLLHQEHPEKLVLDLRHNGGGDFSLGLKYLIEPLQKEKAINRKGHLFVLIGVGTFSAAMSNAAQFRTMTNAMLVGQPIGERPNSYQEVRQFTLPNSRLVVHYSTRFYKFTNDPANVIAPDKEIIPTWDDYKNGRDPVLEWVLAGKGSTN